MWRMTTVKDALDALDTMEDEPSRFEAHLLETVTRQVQAGRLPSPKQHRILCEMVEKYLGDAGLLRDVQNATPTGEKE
jgi:hypothetical protein